MSKTQDSQKNKSPFQIFRWEKQAPLTQEEAEARLSQEGYQSFCWYDVPGVNYPLHRHSYDECLWVLRGELHIVLLEEDLYVLKSGDRIDLPKRTPHTAKTPLTGGVTYLVGRRKESSR